ncbi:MAG: hypothetical protein ACFUZC_16595 [Chthoniobacteraceae bacterium]
MSDEFDFKIDANHAFENAFKRYASTSKRQRKALLDEQGRIFVKEVILVTPPNKDLKANRKGGEQTIATDIKKIFRGSKSKKAITDLAAMHKQYRQASSGRVGKGPGKKIPARGLRDYIKAVQARVGILASGWNTAAVQLGVKVPPWIAQHGTGRGQIFFKLGDSECRLTIVNRVKFAGGVRGIARRVQWVLNRRAGAMNRRVDDYEKKAAQKAGLK